MSVVGVMIRTVVRSMFPAVVGTVFTALVRMMFPAVMRVAFAAVVHMMLPAVMRVGFRRHGRRRLLRILVMPTLLGHNSQMKLIIFLHDFSPHMKH